MIGRSSMSQKNVACGHPLTERFWAEEQDILCLRCFESRLWDPRDVDLLGKDLRNLNTCLRHRNDALIQRLCSPRANRSPGGIRLIKRLLLLCSSMKSLSATGYKAITFVVLAFESHTIPLEVFSLLLPHLLEMPRECRAAIVHLTAKARVPHRNLSPHAGVILEAMESNMSRAAISFCHDLVVDDLNLLNLYTKKLLHLLKQQRRAVTTRSILRGLHLTATKAPHVLLEQQESSILQILDPFMSKEKSEIICGLFYLCVKDERARDLMIANDVAFRLAESSLVCVNVDCVKILLQCLRDLFRLKRGPVFTSDSVAKIFTVLLVLQEVTVDQAVALNLLHLLTSLIECKQFRGIGKDEGDLLLAQLNALCQKDVPEIGTAAVKCFGCSLVTDKLPSDVSFDRCLNMFAKCIRAFEKEKITLEHFVDCATALSKWSIRVKNESRQRRTPQPFPVEFVPDWIDNFVLELLKRLLTDEGNAASRPTRRRVLVLLKNSLELVGSDRSPKHWDACLKLSWALVEREMDSAEARAFIATFISTLSPTTERRLENARYLHTSAPVDLESTQDGIVACLILYNTAAHFLPHKDPPPLERLCELIESILRCGFRWRRENLVRAVRLLVELLPSEAGNPIRGSLRKLILSLPPDILRDCLSSLANSQTTRRLIFDEQEGGGGGFERLANQLIEELCTSKKMGELITAAETASTRLSKRIVDAVLSIGVHEQLIEETKRRRYLPESLVEGLFEVVATHRDRDLSPLLKVLDLLDPVTENSGKYLDKLVPIAKALMQIYSIEQSIEIPNRLLRILKLGFDIRSILISNGEHVYLQSFFQAVVHNDWLTGLELYLEIEEKLPHVSISLAWNELETYLRDRGEKSGLVMRSLSLSFNENPRVTIEPAVDLEFLRTFCSWCLESAELDSAAFDVLSRMDHPMKWTLPSLVALARTERTSEYSVLVTAQLINHCLDLYRIEWIESLIGWYTDNALEIGPCLWADFAARVVELTEICPSNPFEVKAPTIIPESVQCGTFRFQNQVSL